MGSLMSREQKMRIHSSNNCQNYKVIDRLCAAKIPHICDTCPTRSIIEYLPIGVQLIEINLASRKATVKYER